MAGDYMTKALRKIKKENKRLEKIEKKLNKEREKIEWQVNNEEKVIENHNKKEYYKSKNEPPKRPLLEEIGNSITHGIGTILSIVALILLIINSSNSFQLTAAIIYGISMIFMMLMSTLYHAFKSGSKVKRIWRRFDYTSIYLLIGGTFTPMLLVFFHEYFPKTSIVFLIIQWIVIMTGITIVSVFGPGRVKFLHYVLYIILGWCGLLFIPTLIKNNLNLFLYILIGGVVYTIGLIPFALKKKTSHFIWHFFVLAGAIVQFLGIFINLY